MRHVGRRFAAYICDMHNVVCIYGIMDIDKGMHVVEASQWTRHGRLLYDVAKCVTLSLRDERRRPRCHIVVVVVVVIILIMINTIVAVVYNFARNHQCARCLCFQM